MYTLLKPLQVREELMARKITIFTPREFELVFRLPKYKAKYYLEKESMDGGLLLRLKKGLYGLKTDLPQEEVIANALYKPSYISFEYALAYYNILPEMAYAVTSATTKPTRIFTAGQMTYGYYTIKEEAYTGYSLLKIGTKSFLIADPEKALADYMYFETLGKRPHNDRLVFSKINKEKLLGYLGLFRRKSLIKFAKETMNAYF